MQLRTLAALLLAATSLLSENGVTLRGRVLDPTGSAVPGATVTLFTRDGAAYRTAVAAADGRFEWTTLAPADYLLEAQASGFASSKVESVQLAPGAVSERDLKLELARVSTRVVVTASGTAQTTDETAKAFDIVDSGQIGRRDEFSIAETLRLTPGMRVVQLGGPGSLMRIQTRGTRTFDTSVLIDGFRFRDVSAPQADAMGFLGDLAVANTDRVEVLRGSGSSLYGTHAIGGVVNIVTDHGGGAPRGEILAEGGGLGFLRGLAKVAGGAWNDRVQYSLGLTHVSVLSGVDGDDRMKSSTAQGYLQYRLAPRTSISGRLFENFGFAGLNSSPSPFSLASLPASLPVPAIAGVTFNPSLNDPDSRRVNHFTSAIVNATHQWTPRVTLRGFYHGLVTSRDNRNGPAPAPTGFNTANRFDGRIDNAQARADYAPSPHHSLTAGWELEREYYDNVATDQNPNLTARVFSRTHVPQTSHSWFAQEQSRWLDDRLHISLSGRAQTFTLSRPQFEGGAPRYAAVAIPQPPNAYTGDVAVAYFAQKSGTKLRTHAGNSYRVPALYERFGTFFFGGSFSAIGDPRLAPERAISVDGGFDQYLATSRVKVSATYFYTRLQQVIGFGNVTTDPFERFSGYINTGGGLARGVELSAEANPSRKLHLFGSYTYTNADDRTSTVLGGAISSIRISDHMATFTATQTIARGLDATFDLFAASDYVYPLFVGGSRPFVFEGPVKADLVVTYRHPLSDKRALEFHTKIDNVFNRAYYEDGFRTPKAWAIAGMKFLF